MEQTQEKRAEMSPEETMPAENTAPTLEQENPAADAENEDTGKQARELEELKDKFIRLVAEFDNYKKRTSRERLDLIQTAGRDVISSLLDVLDDCDRAEKQMNQSENYPQLKEGVQLIFNKLRTSLQARGLKAMESIEQDFDVEKHEAITEMPAPSDALKNKVLDEVQKGYLLNDKIIRFAKVVVGK